MKTRITAAGALACAILLAPALAAADHQLNVNTATEAELMKLPEMNEARAKAIVNYRASEGELIQLEELELLTNVKPIYPKIKNHLVLE